MKIEITPAMAQEIMYMFEDWDEVFSTSREEYKRGYIASTKDFLDTLNITEEQLREYLAQY